MRAWIAERVAVIYAGRIVEQGPSERVQGAPQDAYTRALLNAALEGRLDGVGYREDPVFGYGLVNARRALPRPATHNDRPNSGGKVWSYGKGASNGQGL